MRPDHQASSRRGLADPSAKCRPNQPELGGERSVNEASELRDALDLVLAAGSSSWNACLMWEGYETDVDAGSGWRNNPQLGPSVRERRNSPACKEPGSVSMSAVACDWR